MKNIKSFLILALVISVFTLSVFAVEMQIAVTDPVYNTDGTFSVDVVINNNTGFGMLCVELEFDNTVLELVNVSKTVTCFTTTPIDPANTRGIWAFAYAGTQNETYSGKVATLSFKVKDNAACGTTELNLVYDENENFAYDSTGINEIPLSFTTKDTSFVAHNYRLTSEAVDATCTTDGKSAVYTCTGCGATKGGDTITALGHDFATEFTVDEEVTCITNGFKSRHCSRCSEIADGTVIYANGHDFTNETIISPADLGVAGLKSHTCSKCGLYEEVEIPAFVKTTISATDATVGADGAVTVDVSIAENIGLGALTFSVVYDTDVLTLTNIDKSYSEFTVTPVDISNDMGECTLVYLNENLVNFTDNGKLATFSFTADKNADCITAVKVVFEEAFTYSSQDMTDVSIYTEDGEVLNHTFSNEFTVDIFETCTTAGSKSRHCTKCDVKTEATAIPATGHSFGDWTVKVPADLDVDGVEERVCTACGATETRPIPAIVPEDAAFIVVENVRTNPGKTVSVDVTMKQNSGFAGIYFTLNFDSPYLTLTDIDKSNAIVACTATPTEIANNNKAIIFTYAATENINGNGKVATLTFTVSEDAPVDTLIPLTVTVSKSEKNCFYYGEDGVSEHRFIVGVENGSIEVADFTPGDVDDDGDITIRDAARILQYCAAWEVYINLDAADVDGDGRVTIRDAARILQYKAGWDVTLG